MDALLLDLRLAIRGLRQARGFTLTAILTLTVAVALNVIVYTVRDAMLFRGLPQARQSDRLVYMAMRRPTDMACCPSAVRFSDFETWRSQSQTLDLTFGRWTEPSTLRVGESRAIDLQLTRHTVNLFGLLGVRPAVGRDFVAGDAAAGAPPVALISHQFWKARLGAREDIAGLTVHVNGSPATVIGVLPEHFALVYQHDLFMPLVDGTGLEGAVIGRLRDGASLEAARAEIDTITRAIQAADPSLSSAVPVVRTYSDYYVAPDAPRIYGALWTGAWFVLLIACANLANLALVRTIGRRREFSTRLALGAGRARTIRQLLIEHAIIGGIASAIAWPLVTVSVRRWAEATASRYLALDYSITAGTLIYLAAIAVVAVIAVAALPIARILQLSVSESLKGDARGVTQGTRGKRLTRGLVAVQMALAMVLVLGAGVLVRSFENIVGADTGVRAPEDVLMGSVRLPSDKYPTASARLQFFDRLETQLRSIAQGADVSFSNTFPTRGLAPARVEIEGRAAADDNGEGAQYLGVGPRYFRVMGTPPVIGRDFDANDVNAGPIALVNEAFAAKYWVDGNALGKRIRFINAGKPGPWRTVVGIAPNIMQGDPTRQEFRPLIYLSFRQQPPPRAYFFVRTHWPPEQLLQAVVAEVQRLDADLTAEQLGSLKAAFAFDRDYMDLEHADLGKHAAIAPVFAIVALLLSAIGLVAVITQSVSQRTREIGIRMAIGAATRDIATMIVREGMRPVAVGLVSGVFISLGANRLLQSQLVGISPYDPLTMAAGPMVLIMVALIGCRIPARRASRVDPVVALRHDG